ARLLLLVAGAVAGVVVVGGVGQVAVAARLQEGRPFAGAGPLDRPRGGVKHRLHVHAVDGLAGDAVTRGPGRDLRARRFQPGGHRLRVEVVLHTEHAGQLVDRRDVHRFVDFALL